MSTPAPAAPAAPATPPATPAPAAPPAAPSYFNADGSFGENWHLGLGDEFSPHAAQLGTFKNVAGLAKSYIHLRTSGAPTYPGEGSSAEDVARFRQFAHVPEKADGYGLVKPEKLPEGVEWNDAAVSRIADLAHKHHVPAEALRAIVNEHVTMEGERAAAYKAELERAAEERRSALIGEWKGDFEANTSIVRHHAEKIAAMAAIAPDHPDFGSMVDHPLFAKMMLQVAKLTGEDGYRAPSGLGDVRSPQQQADDIMSGKDPVWGAKYQVGDQEAMVHVGKLLDQAQKG